MVFTARNALTEKALLNDYPIKERDKSLPKTKKKGLAPTFLKNTNPKTRMPKGWDEPSKRRER